MDTSTAPSHSAPSAPDQVGPAFPRITLYRRERSPFWCAWITLPGKARRGRSTGVRLPLSSCPGAWEQSRERALQRAREIARHLQAQAESPWNPRLSELRDHYLEWRRGASQNLADGGESQVRAALRALRKWAGGEDRLAARFSPEEVDTFIVALTQSREEGGLGLAPSTARKYLQTLRAIWRAAIRRRWFFPEAGIDPWAGCTLPRSIGSPKEDAPKAFSFEEMAELLRNAPPEWRFPILFGGYAGLRLGDAVEIAWDSVDLYRGILTYPCEKTKTKSAVPIAEPLRQELARTPPEERSGPLSPLAGRPRSSLCRSFRRVLQSAHLEGQGRSFHGLRRLFLTSLPQPGESEKDR